MVFGSCSKHCSVSAQRYGKRDDRLARFILEEQKAGAGTGFGGLCSTTSAQCRWYVRHCFRPCVHSPAAGQAQSVKCEARSKKKARMSTLSKGIVSVQ